MLLLGVVSVECEMVLLEMQLSPSPPRNLSGVPLDLNMRGSV